jgi:hypothetical protein
LKEFSTLLARHVDLQAGLATVSAESAERIAVLGAEKNELSGKLDYRPKN